VIWLDKANISPQCGGNGVTVYNNNTVRITDSVIQGFGMWAENTQTLLGNYGGTDTTNVYMEEGAGPCPHPYNPGSGSVFSAAGIIWGDGSSLNIHGGSSRRRIFRSLPVRGHAVGIRFTRTMWWFMTRRRGSAVSRCWRDMRTRAVQGRSADNFHMCPGRIREML
jgi:hypothetical protein